MSKIFFTRDIYYLDVFEASHKVKDVMSHTLIDNKETFYREIRLFEAML